MILLWQLKQTSYKLAKLTLKLKNLLYGRYMELFNFKLGQMDTNYIKPC